MNRLTVNADALNKLVSVVGNIAEFAGGAPRSVISKNDNFLLALEITASEALENITADISPAKKQEDLEYEIKDAYEEIYKLKGLLHTLKEWYQKRMKRSYLDDGDEIWDRVKTILNPTHQPLMLSHELWKDPRKEKETE